MIIEQLCIFVGGVLSGFSGHVLYSIYRKDFNPNVSLIVLMAIHYLLAVWLFINI